MNMKDAIQAAQTSPLLSKFEIRQISTLVATLKMVSYAASHPECQGSEPPLQEIDAFMEANPDLVNVYAQVAHLVLTDLASIDYPQVPSHELFANTLWPAVGGVLSIAATGELHPSLEQIQEQLDNPLIKSLLDRTLTILWTTFFPGQPLANGTIYNGVEDFAKVCRGELDA